MSTPLTDLIPMFNREVNAPGIELFSTITAAAKLGYIEDGFWDVRLAGMLGSYTVALGEDINPVGTTGVKYFTDLGLTGDDLEQQFWMMIIIFAGFRIIRLKIMNLAVNFTAKAGPVSYEQQASATVLRALLDSLNKRVQELKAQYSDSFNQSVFVLMDGLAQAEYSTLNGLADMQVVY